MKRSREYEQSVLDFLRHSGCDHTLEGHPIPRYCSVLKKYHNIYGGLLIGNECRRNNINAVFIRKYDPFHTRAPRVIEPVQKSIFDYVSGTNHVPEVQT